MWHFHVLYLSSPLCWMQRIGIFGVRVWETLWMLLKLTPSWDRAFFRLK